jgi:hypothetical protein
LAIKALSDPSLVHIFGNTTLEFPLTIEYAKHYRINHPQSIFKTAENREQLGDLMQAVRTTVVSFFDGYTPPADPKAEDLTRLIPTHYALTASGIGYDPDKPCYYQTLMYNCDTTV